MQQLSENDELINYALGEKIELKDKLLVSINSDNKLVNKISLDKVKFRKITKIVFDKNEDSLEKLTTVLSSVNSANADIVYVLKNNPKDGLSFYIGVMNNLKNADQTLYSALQANFPGCEISKSLSDSNEEKGSLELKKIKESILNEKYSVSLSTSIPSLKNEDNNSFIQGLEKFLLAMQHEEYTAILLAKNVSSFVEERKYGYEELYTNLFPLVSNDLILGSNVSFSQSDSKTASFSETITKSSSKTHSEGTSESENEQYPSILQKVQMTGIPNILAIGAGALAIAGTGGAAAPVVGALGVALGIGATIGTTKKLDKNNTYFNSKTKNTSTTENDSETSGESIGETNSISIGKTNSETKGESLQTTLKMENKYLKNQLEIIDMQLERIKYSQNYGMFDFADYFLAPNIETTIIAANIYNSLIRGEESYIGHSYIQSFKSEDASQIKNALARFEHPKFLFSEEKISITSMINSKELAIALSFPKKSLQGLFVKECVEFGRNINSIDEEKSIAIGNIYHLGKEYEKQAISFNLKDLTMHTLITGSTGSGKSTTTYKLIDEIKYKNIKFLVIEPTKGEYKNIFGNQSDVKVYGTNENFTELLKINPFSFPFDKIHLLEHIDRLVEIFNACWPMYSAMPAVMKDAILRAYESCGWDIDESMCEDLLLPTFEDILEQLNIIMDNSQYSNEIKSNYKGALSTRLESLTKGLIGKIFTEDEMDDKALFEENVIIDLSRVGSAETKSLIMGILFLKLNEYRISTENINSDLKHITILEEAHHLLPRTSKEISSESGNIKGKAVEMLSNAIAEMRTYGEGFIIIDQSPNMLDISAIRNTNTKIIMRLSEIEDRNDIGKSVALTDEQINEIPKLSQGVAIVYQNGWDEAVLCKIIQSNIEKNIEPFKYEKKEKNYNSKTIISNLITSIILCNDFQQDEMYKDWSYNNSMNQKILNYVSQKERNTKDDAKFVNYLIKGKKLYREIKEQDNDFTELIKEMIEQKIIIYEDLGISKEKYLWHIIQLIKIDNSYNQDKIIREYEINLEKFY